MTVTLKNYQNEAMKTVNEYVDKIHKQCGIEKNPISAAFKLMKKEYFDHGINAPSICIKVPTGGGKTLLASNLVGLVHKQCFKDANDAGLVLWLVPSDAILEQTITALKDSKHDYHKALKETFGNIKVFDMSEALALKKSDVLDNLCIIVSTFAAFRTEDTEKKMAKKNVFKENGALMDHFENNSETTPSLHEVIKLYTPIVVLDEGHHVKTKLSYEMIQNFNPGFVMEFTATPRMEQGMESNILVDVKAIELKKEGMIKMPIIHRNESEWQKAVDEGIKQRHLLEKSCKEDRKKTGKYIRPIVLIQAERDDSKDSDQIDVLQVKKYLMKNHEIPEDEIAIKTGTKDDLKDKNLKSISSKIKYVITVKALAEGWDNAFAYVLVSIMNTKSRLAGEQLLGRILRMPYQERRSVNDLNQAYVFTSSSNFKKIIEELENELVANGYEKKDIVNTNTNSVIHSSAKQMIQDNDIKLPCVTVKGKSDHLLDYVADLIGGNLSLKENYIVKIDSLLDSTGIVAIDLNDSGIFRGEIQKTLDEYSSKYYTKTNLMQKLGREIRRGWCSSKDMNNYLKKVIDSDIKSSDDPEKRIIDLSKDIRTVINTIDESINKHEQNHTKKTFSKLLDEDKLICTYKSLSLETSLPDPLENKYKKHLYDQLEEMNEEEENLADEINKLEQVKWWYRNPVMTENSFYVQGWENRQIFPDFIIKTHNGKYFIVEYKGGQLRGNPDTQYKEEVLQMLSDLAGPNYDVRVVYDGQNMKRLVNDIKSS